MARPREFDRESALEKATNVFWSKGFAATSTDDLLQAMGIGRQSLYNAFGDKRQLYLEALRTYQRNTTSDHVRRLNGPASVVAGITDLLVGLVSDDNAHRALGCMGVGSVGEFGVNDAEVVALREKISPMLHGRLVARIAEGQDNGEIEATLDPQDAAIYVQTMMTGLQTAARAGSGADELHRMARFAVDLLKTK
ncbi:TetR/AcrR family transcriptional regulator [Novosphingobium sp. P6W]|nr:TetR/AcrR family transcriptional regulator [Novosphingobium sp. P6W]KIS30042.1 TetR family transcriptional regulator [Novosphingobium sp. P6W]